MYINFTRPFLKHFISSLIRIKFERTQTHFCEVFTVVVVFVAFKKLPISTNWLDWLADVLMFMRGKESRYLLIANE